MFKTEWKHFTKLINIWVVLLLYVIGNFVYLGMTDVYIDTHVLDKSEYYESFFGKYEGKWTLDKSQQYKNTQKDLVTEQYVNYVEANPKFRYLIKQTGWEAWLGNERFDYFMIILIIGLSCFIVTYDYEVGTYMWKLNTKQKKDDYRRVWCLEIILCALSLVMINFVVKWVYYAFKYNLSYYDAPLQSLWTFQNSILPISLFQAAILMQVMQLLGVLFIVIVSQIVAYFIKSMRISLVVNFILFVIPFFLFNRESLRYIIQPMGMLLSSGYLRGNSDCILYDGVQVGWPFCHLSEKEIFCLIISFIVITLVLYFLYMFGIRTFLSIFLKNTKLFLKSCLIIFILSGLFFAFYNQSKVEIKKHVSYYTGKAQFTASHSYFQTSDDIVEFVNGDDLNNGVTLNKDVFDQNIRNYCTCGNKIFYYTENIETGIIKIYCIDSQNYNFEKVYEEERGLKHYFLSTKYLGLLNHQNYHNESDENLAKDMITNMWISDGYIYISDQNSIERIHMVTHQKEVICEEYFIQDSIAYDGTWIYYIDSNNEVKAIQPSTRRMKQYHVSAQGKLCVLKKNIYYVGKDNLLYCLEEDKSIPVNKVRVAQTSRVNGMKQALYYISDEGKLIKYDIETNKTKKIAMEDKMLDVMVFPGEKIFYYFNQNDEFIWKEGYIRGINF